MVSRQMGVAQRHRNVSVPQQFFDSRKVHTCHHQPTGERMAYIVERKVLNAGLADRAFKRGPKRAVRLTMPIAEYSSPFSGV